MGVLFRGSRHIVLARLEVLVLFASFLDETAPLQPYEAAHKQF